MWYRYETHNKYMDYRKMIIIYKNIFGIITPISPILKLGKISYIIYPQISNSTRMIYFYLQIFLFRYIFCTKKKNFFNFLFFFWNRYKGNGKTLRKSQVQNKRQFMVWCIIFILIINYHQRFIISVINKM